MSTTRIIFIIVCVVGAVFMITLGIIIQKNNPDSKYSVTNALRLNPSGKRQKKLRLPKNPSSFLTIFLVILLLFLVLVFSRK